GADLREKQIVKWMRRAEGIPKTSVGVEHTFVDLAVVRTEINRLLFRVKFIKAVWIDNTAVESAVERSIIVAFVRLDFHSSQRCIPGFLSLRAHRVEIRIPELLLQVAHGLFRTDEGRSHPTPNHLARCGIKFDERARSLVLQLRLALLYRLGGPYALS